MDLLSKVDYGNNTTRLLNLSAVPLELTFPQVYIFHFVFIPLKLKFDTCIFFARNGLKKLSKCLSDIFFYIRLIKILSHNHNDNDYIIYGNHLTQKINGYLATDCYYIIVITDY